jgi:uncharacterized membrane protein YdjX (TVP38/TMEM64 family)
MQKMSDVNSHSNSQNGSWSLLQERQNDESTNKNAESEVNRSERIVAATNDLESTLNPSSSSSMSKLRTCSKGKLILAILWILFIILLIVDSTSSTKYALSIIQIILRWIQGNPIPGFVACIVVYTIATILCLPGSLLTLAIGFIFSNSLGILGGVFIGTLAVCLGASAGAILAWCLSRYVFRATVAQYVMDRYTSFQALDNALKLQGLKIMFLLRLSPIIPFNALNYLAGITAISLKDYSIALLGIVPGTVVYVLLGASAGSLAEIQAGKQTAPMSGLMIAILVVGIISGLTAVGLTSFYAKREFHRVLEERQQEG